MKDTTTMSSIGETIMIGVIGTLGYKIGMVLSGDNPLTYQDILEAVGGGTLGGILGECMLNAFDNLNSAAAIGGLMAGFFHALIADSRTAP
jgi:hypothetical protein